MTARENLCAVSRLQPDGERKPQRCSPPPIQFFLRWLQVTTAPYRRGSRAKAPEHPRLLNYPWPQFQRDAQHSGIDHTVLPAGVPLSSEFFPASRAYNWPNPVYDGKTFIRYYVKENATVRVKIYDLAGDLAADLSGTGQGGVDNEIAWDVSGVQSGIYFARIEASGTSGSGGATVKIAVVK